MESYKIIGPYGFQKDRMQAALQARGIDSLLLTSPENVFYVTGYTVLPSSGNPILYTLRNRLPYAVHVASSGKVSLICWGFSVEGVGVGADEIVPFNTAEQSVEEVLRVVAPSKGSSSRVAVESTMPFALSEAIRAKHPSIELVDGDEAMEELRLIKSVSEVEQLTQSTRKIEQTMQELYETIHVGMSRLELIREAKYRLLKNGADGVSHATFAFGKDNPEIALDEKLEENNLITLDLGGILNGYCSDTRRYVFSGRLSPELVERYDRMVAIVDGVGEALKPEAPYAEITQRALELFKEHGEEPLGRMTHVGHNIGLETEEQWVDASDKRVRTGMVINIELYTKAAPYGQIGNEETFVVEKTGPRRISQLPRRIVEL